MVVGSVLGIALGGWLAIAGREDAADLVWAITTVIGGVPLLLAVVRGIVRREPGVDVIALLAIVGSLALGQYLAGAVVALMLSTGQALESFAERRAHRELSALLERAPQQVHRYEDGELRTRPIEDVVLGDLLFVMTGEVVPVDGVVELDAVLDESALTGESRPVERPRGDRVRSGAVNAGPAFDLRATSTASDSTYAGIVRLVEEAEEHRAPFVRLADRYALIFIPVTLVVAGLAWALSGDPVRALSVLVVATPCPLILAVPIAVVAGISRAAKRGIIVKGGGALETLARADTLLFDKTGTLTSGIPAVAEVEAFGDEGPDELLRLAASLDQVSPHVLAGSIVREAGQRDLDLAFPVDVDERYGAGDRGVGGGPEGRARQSGLRRGRRPAPAPGARRPAPDDDRRLLVRVRGGRRAGRRRDRGRRSDPARHAARDQLAPSRRDRPGRDGDRRPPRRRRERRRRARRGPDPERAVLPRRRSRPSRPSASTASW